jgi:toxin ParE1/3/4
VSDYGLTKRARDDLFDIFLFGYEKFGERQAEAYAADLEHVFQLLAENPRLGRNADVIVAGVRRYEHQSHILLYQEMPSGVLILAVVHKSSVRRLSL